MADALTQTSRTVPTRNTTGVLTPAFDGFAPIDAYGEEISRPLAYFESTIATAVTAATASIPTVYVTAKITSGMSGAMSGTAGQFVTHEAGTSIGQISGLASWVYLDDALVHAGGVAVQGTTSPLSVGVRCQTGSTITFGGNVTYGIFAQFINNGTGTPDKVFFARLSVSPTESAATALIYAEQPAAVGYVNGVHKSGSPAGYFPLILVHGGGYGDVPLYVNVWQA